MKYGFAWVAIGSVAVVAGLILVLSLGSRDGSTPKGTLHFYCAAGIRKAVEKTIKEYEDEFEVTIDPHYMGSGKLLVAIRGAGGGDLYLAASSSYMDDARKHPETMPEEIQPLAHQHAALVVYKGNPKNIKSLEDLLHKNVRVSLANPEIAAISRTARQSLTGMKKDGKDLWDALYEAKIVARDTVNAVANDVKIKTTDAGIVWDATANQYPELTIVPVPQFEGTPKQILIAVLSSSSNPTLALHFMRYLSARDEGLKKFKDLGYDVVEGDKWDPKPELIVFSGGLNRPAIYDTIRAFEKREGVKVSDSYDGCGNLVGQIKTSADPDIYFACDTSFMSKVEKFGFPISHNVSSTRMVMIVHKDNRSKLNIKTLQDLKRKKLKVGVCHHEKSALGELTKNLLEKHNIWEDVKVNFKNTAATADVLVAQVVIGALDVAIVYRANTTRQADKLEVIKIPDDEANAIQPIAVADNSDYKYLAGRLMKKIRSAESLSKFKKLGFIMPTVGSTP